jgi:hypothetical protein
LQDWTAFAVFRETKTVKATFSLKKIRKEAPTCIRKAISTTNVVTTPNTKPKTPFATAEEPMSTSTCKKKKYRLRCIALSTNYIFSPTFSFSNWQETCTSFVLLSIEKKGPITSHTGRQQS